MSWLDLHMHSDVSDDGEFSPKALMGLCSDAGLKAVALSDHNSVGGIEEAAHYAKKSGFDFIPAVELDCTYKDINLHVLGYGINISDSRFGEIERDIEKQERAAAAKRIKLVDEAGIAVDYERVMSLSKNGVVTGEMIAEAALNDKRNRDNPLLAPFRSGGKRGDNPYVNFYWDYCSKGKPAYVHIRFIGLTEAVDVIRSAGGVAVLAHPGNNIGRDEEILSEIINTGVSGIEVYSSYHDVKTTGFYQKQADKYRVLKTVGSDFHGKTKPAIKLGGVECWDNEGDIYKSLLESIKRG